MNIKTIGHGFQVFDPKNISNGVLEYHIFAPIGVNDSGDGISGQRFADDLNFINNAMKNDVTRINVRINSPGGSIIEGLAMLSAIRNSTIPVDTYIEGVAASMAFVIAMSGQQRFANDFSRAMIHDPNIDTADVSDQEKTILAEFKNMLIHVFKNNSKLSESEIDAIMTAETWYDAKQMLDAGLIDSIVKTERNLGLFANSSKTILNFANDLLIEKISNTKKTFQMKKIFAKLTDLKRIKNVDETENEKIESAAVETITELSTENGVVKSENETLKTENETLKTENETLKSENETLKTADQDNAAIDAVENAIKSGKVLASKKDEMLVIAKNNLDSFKKMISSIPASKKITNAISFGTDATNTVDDQGKINGKGLRELEKSNPKLVSDILNNDVDAYNRMYVAQYGKQPKK